MVNDMPYHIQAWHNQIIALGGNLTLEEMKHQCYGKNDELLERVFPGRFSLEERINIGNEKEALYRVEFKPFLKLITGLDTFLQKANEKNIKMGIGSAAITENIEFVLHNTVAGEYINIIVSANDVSQSKPHPETFLKCAMLLNAAPHECLVFEDTPKGVECALNAGMKAIVILGEHEQHEFEHFGNVIYYAKDYTALNEFIATV
jgi:beta-phosphoglucomutase-like phosphatase (HAD superfamily)